MFRQYFPKRTGLRKVTWKQVKDAVDSFLNKDREKREIIKHLANG